MTAREHLDAAVTAAFLDQGLAPDERERAAAHLADCAECRARLAAQVRAESRGAVTPIESRGGRRAAWVPLLAAATVGALLLGVGLWLAVGGRRSDRLAERGAPPAERPAAGREPAVAEPPEEAPPPGVEEPRPGELADRPRQIPDREPGPPQLDIPDRPAPDNPAEELLALRGGTRVVESRTFRLQGDTWVDASYRQLDHGAPRDVERGAQDYEELVAREPRVARWAALGPRVLIVLDSIPYRLLPPTD